MANCQMTPLLVRVLQNLVIPATPRRLTDLQPGADVLRQRRLRRIQPLTFLGLDTLPLLGQQHCVFAKRRVGVFSFAAWGLLRLSIAPLRVCMYEGMKTCVCVCEYLCVSVCVLQWSCLFLRRAVEQCGTRCRTETWPSVSSKSLAWASAGNLQLVPWVAVKAP